MTEKTIPDQVCIDKTDCIRQRVKEPQTFITTSTPVNTAAAPANTVATTANTTATTANIVATANTAPPKANDTAKHS